MAVAETLEGRRVLLVDDEAALREMMSETLGEQGFHVVCAGSVVEALKHITQERFDVLLTDLHMPNPGDGFTVITAMRHCQPEALTLLMSGYPDVQTAMSTILLEADKIVVKPFDGRNFAEFVRIALLDQRPAPCLRKEKWRWFCNEA